MDWPIYKKNLLILGNLQSSVGICTLWTQRQRIAKGIDPNLFSVIGNLYSGKRGLDPLIRNLLANPRLRHLVVCGSDISGSGQTLIDFFKNGFEKESEYQADYWLVKSKSEGKVDIEVSEEALKQLRQQVEIFDCRGITDLAELSRLILTIKPLSAWSEPRVFPKKEPRSEIFPSESSIHVIRGRTVAECWLKLLREIIQFGIISSTHYENRQKEILNLVTIISQEDPHNPFIPEWMPHSKEHLEAYYLKILTAKQLPDMSYAYGHRMRAYFGRDQIQDVINKLKREPDSRSAVVSLWDAQRDNISGSSPCLNHLWFRLRQGKLFLTAVIRSNDMFEGWPENAFGLRQLQQLVTQEIGNCQLGELTIVSESAHLYDDCWEEAGTIVKEHWHEVIQDPRNIRDPRANFIISVENGEIKVEHCSPQGDALQVFRGKSAYELRTKIASFISLIEHGIYLGSELQKAEIALRFDIPYVQDQPLNLKP